MARAWATCICLIRCWKTFEAAARPRRSALLALSKTVRSAQVPRNEIAVPCIDDHLHVLIEQVAFHSLDHLTLRLSIPAITMVAFGLLRSVFYSQRVLRRFSTKLREFRAIEWVYPRSSTYNSKFMQRIFWRQSCVSESLLYLLQECLVF